MPSTGHFVLHTSVMPTLTAGRYQLVSEQSGLPFTVASEHTHVTVASPRYALPPEQILSTFPPANAQGAFGDRLPQIVLKRRTLPWERNPAGVSAPSPTPWLALVVVAEGEAELSTATPVAECVTAGTALLDPSDRDVEQGLYLAVTETVLNKVFPCEEDLALLTHVREVDVSDTELANGDDDGWLAVVLANRLPVSDQANGKAVRYMACLVNVEGQLGALPTPQPFVEDFAFARVQDFRPYAELFATPDARVMGLADFARVTPGVVAAQPRAPGPFVSGAATSQVGVTLDGAARMRESAASEHWASAPQRVSAAALDPDAKRLVRDTMGMGFRAPIGLLALEKVYRFPVLAHWSFTTDEGATFETLMQELDVSLLGTLPSAPVVPPAARTPPEVMETGHVGLGHRARRGDAGRAWYRGPLVPFPTKREQVQDGVLQVAHAADQLRAVVPDGREDLSLAAAFEIGRLLGVSQLSVVSALLRFRGERFGEARVRELLAQVTPFPLPELGEARLDLGRLVALQMLDDLARQPAEMLGPRRPIADPGRELALEGELDVAIAAGLGFDLAQVKRQAERVGVLAALSETSVPVASAQGGFALDERALSSLQGALRREIEHVVDIAAPQRGPSKRGEAARSASAPLGDALDALIETAASNGRAEED